MTSDCCFLKGGDVGPTVQLEMATQTLQLLSGCRKQLWPSWTHGIGSAVSASICFVNRVVFFLVSILAPLSIACKLQPFPHLLSGTCVKDK